MKQTWFLFLWRELFLNSHESERIICEEYGSHSECFDSQSKRFDLHEKAFDFVKTRWGRSILSFGLSVSRGGWRRRRGRWVKDCLYLRRQDLENLWNNVLWSNSNLIVLNQVSGLD